MNDEVLHKLPIYYRKSTVREKICCNSPNFIFRGKVNVKIKFSI